MPFIPGSRETFLADFGALFVAEPADWFTRGYSPAAAKFWRRALHDRRVLFQQGAAAAAQTDCLPQDNSGKY
jgi:hypothetical protein